MSDIISNKYGIKFDIVTSNLDSLIKFFSHKTFYDVMNQQNELESMTEGVQEVVQVGRAR